MDRLQRSLLFIAHRTAQIRRDLTDWHFILTSSKGCVYATPPQIWWKKTAELPQQPCVSSLKVTDCFLSEVVWHSVPDKLGMMVALCLLEPTKPLTLLPQFCQTSFLWLPSEPGKKSLVFKRNLQIFQTCCWGGRNAAAQKHVSNLYVHTSHLKEEEETRFLSICHNCRLNNGCWEQEESVIAALRSSCSNTSFKNQKSWKILTKKLQFGTNKWKEVITAEFTF